MLADETIGAALLLLHTGSRSVRLGGGLAALPRAERHWHSRGYTAGHLLRKPRMLWKVAIPGRGLSSPIVVGGKLFMQSASDDGAKRFLLCIDAATGKTLWTKEQRRLAKAKTHKKNSLASMTPACDGERVTAPRGTARISALLAYDLSGKELWQQPLGGFVSQHGPANSPSVYQGIVSVNVDEDADLGGKAILSAFDGKTGEKKWAVARKPYPASYTVPFLLERPNHPAALVLGTTTAVTGYEPATGRRSVARHRVAGRNHAAAHGRLPGLCRRRDRLFVRRRQRFPLRHRHRPRGNAADQDLG